MSEARPVRLSPVDLAGQVTDVRETDDVYRLYVTEWVVMFTDREFDPVKEHYETKYAGRVRQDDVEYALTRDFVQLRLRLPNLVGEFKHAHAAKNFAENFKAGNYTIVARNSKDDHALRQYGVKKLPE